jgi:hypothetical protein
MVPIVIITDNASKDDVFDYVEEIALNIRVANQ